VKILLTGFEPYGSQSTNPSWTMLDDVPETHMGATIVKVEIPVIYDLEGVLAELIDTHSPDGIISFGLHTTTVEPKVEEYGYNYAGGYIDNDGVQLTGLLDKNRRSRAGYKTGITHNDVLRWVGGKYVVTRSESAGTYICNAIIYFVSKILEEQKRDVPFVFTHVPKNPPAGMAMDYVNGMIEHLGIGG